MGLKAMTEVRNTGLLNTKTFIDGLPIKNAVAYVIDTKAGTTKKQEGFYTFYLKDINGIIIPAQVFDVAKFIDSGVSVAGLKRHLAVVSGTIQIFNGSWSCIVKEIRTYNELDDEELTNEPIDLKQFLGSVPEGDTQYFEQMFLRHGGESIPAKYKTSAFEPICTGRVGGYFRLMSDVANSLKTYADLPDVKQDVLEECLVVSSKAYLAYLCLTAKGDFAKFEQITDILFSIRSTHKDSSNLAQILDTCQALMGLGKPEHLYAHIIFNEVSTKLKLYNLVYRGLNVPMNMSCIIGGDTLSKY